MKLFATCAILLFGACALHAQVLLNLTFTGPNTIVITATGKNPVTSNSSYNFLDGFDLEGLFVPTDSGQVPTVISSTLTTGDSSTGPVYNSAELDSVSEDGADLNLFRDSTGTSPTQSFTFGRPAFALGTSLTVNFTGNTFSGIDYGVILAGDTFDSPALKGSTVPIGVYHVVAFAAPSAPEPSTYAMMLGGLALLGFCARLRLATR